MARLGITDVGRTTLGVPFRPRVRLWNDAPDRRWRTVEVTRVETDAGLVGYGETPPFCTWGRATDEAVDRVRGRDAAAAGEDDHVRGALPGGARLGVVRRRDGVR